jgi:hypothetical protein
MAEISFRFQLSLVLMSVLEKESLNAISHAKKVATVNRPASR